MDYAFKFQQVASIISAQFTAGEQFCLCKLLLCSIKEKNNLLTFGFCTLKETWDFCLAGGSSFSAWCSWIYRKILSFTFFPLFSPSLISTYCLRLCFTGGIFIHHLVLLISPHPLSHSRFLKLLLHSALSSSLHTSLNIFHSLLPASFLSGSSVSAHVSISLAVSFRYAWTDSWKATAEKGNFMSSRTTVVVY